MKEEEEEEEEEDPDSFQILIYLFIFGSFADSFDMHNCPFKDSLRFYFVENNVTSLEGFSDPVEMPPPPKILFKIGRILAGSSLSGDERVPASLRILHGFFCIFLTEFICDRRVV